MSRDIDEIPHPIKKLTDGIEFHDMSSQLTAGLGARLRGCSRGRFGDKDTASGLACFPLSSSLGLQRLHSSGSASQAVTSSDLPQCRRKLHLGKNASGLGGMDSFHSSLLHPFFHFLITILTFPLIPLVLCCVSHCDFLFILFLSLQSLLPLVLKTYGAPSSTSSLHASILLPLSGSQG